MSGASTLRQAQCRQVQSHIVPASLREIAPPEECSVSAGSASTLRQAQCRQAQQPAICANRPGCCSLDRLSLCPAQIASVASLHRNDNPTLSSRAVLRQAQQPRQAQSHIVPASLREIAPPEGCSPSSGSVSTLRQAQCRQAQPAGVP